MIDDSTLVASLLEAGVGDQATIDRGIQSAKRANSPLYETLILQRMLSEESVVGIVSKLLNVPFVVPDAESIAEDVRALVPASMARRNRVVPLRVVRGELVLGMADPIDMLAMDEISTHTGIGIRPVLIGPKTLNDTLAAVYGDSTSDFTDEVLASFDALDVAGMMDEVMAAEEWSDGFDAAPLEASEAISQEMRDRPSTDVLKPEDELDEADSIPVMVSEELDRPVDQARVRQSAAILDRYQVDDAIVSDGGLRESSEIVSADRADSLFASGDAAAKVEAKDTRAPSPPSEDSGRLEDTASSHTSLGVGIDALQEGQFGGHAERKRGAPPDDKTGRTQMGFAPKADTNTNPLPEQEAAPEEEAEPEEIDENTDYGALGRAILRAGVAAKKKIRKKETEEVRDSRPTNPHDDSAQVESTQSYEPRGDRSAADETGDPGELPSPDAAESAGAGAEDSEAAADAHNTDVIDPPPEATLPAAEAVPAVDPEEGNATLKHAAVTPEALAQASVMRKAGRAEGTVPPDLSSDEAEREGIAAKSEPGRSELPDDIDPAALSFALARLLVENGILDAHELVELVRRLKE